MPGRVHGEERHGPVRVGPEGGGVEADAVGVRVVVDVAERRQHVGVAREGEEVELLVVEDGRLGAQPGVRRVRVLVDAVVVGAVGQWRHRGHDARPANPGPAGPVISAVASAISVGTASKARWPMPALSSAPV